MTQPQQINLLQAMSVGESDDFPWVSWMPWILSAFILLLGIGLYFKGTSIRALQGQIKGLEEKKTFLIKEMGLSETAMKDVEQTLARTLSERVRWSKLMSEVSLIIPEGVWATGMVSVLPTIEKPGASPQGKPAQDKIGQKVKIMGEALSQEQLTLFLSTLDRSPLLLESKLTHSRKINGEVLFEVVVRLKQEKGL